MQYTPRDAFEAPQRPTSIRQQDQFSQTANRPERHQTLMRRYEVLHLKPNGDIADFVRIAPAIPAFEEAFSAFARGAIFQTDKGPIAVEDLLPGDNVAMADGRTERLLWKGSVMLVPNAEGQSPEMRHLTRISLGSLGLQRPSTDLVLGPAARMIYRVDAVRKLTGQETAFVPVRDFTDGENVVELSPATPVKLFHLGFAGQQKLATGGITVESQHPGLAHLFPLRGELLPLYLSLFPHVRSIQDFAQPEVPRLRLRELDLTDAA